jgi:phosphoglycerol transferase
LKHVGRLANYFLALFGLGLGHWLRHSFGEPSIEQIVYHLRFNEGLVDSGGFFAVTFAVECLALPLGLAGLALSVERALLPYLTGRGVSWLHRLPALVFVGSVLMLMNQLSAGAYLRSAWGGDYFSKNYVSPSTVPLTAVGPRNLVLIYVEGLEDTYGDAAAFGKDLLHELRLVGGESFKHYAPAPGTAWTMGGFVATQCGIPLKAMGLLDAVLGSAKEQPYLPGATCLGDVLQDFGYRNVFMGGAGLAFAAKGRFLADHGYRERYGKREWLRQGVRPDDMSRWGLYDDDLFERAKLRLKELHESGGRFNLTLLTVDTHHPGGFYSKRCKNAGASTFEGIVECTATQLADFVTFVRAQGWLSDTRLVIIGDHLAMPNPAYEKLLSAPSRGIFNLFISDAPLPRATEEILPFDMYPSILQFIGVNVAGGRLGLGYAGFSGAAVHRSRESLDALLSDVLNPSPTYMQLWRARQD